MPRTSVYSPNGSSWRGRLTGLLIALFTAILAILIVYPFIGDVNDGGLTGAVAVYTPLALLDYGVIKIVERRYG